MSLSPGTRLGPYEIVGPLGSGGMGEVYRARDPKLKRDVAIKLLPEAFAADGGRLARFEREAQVLASLSHPNIATVYGLESTGTQHALVMELVEGETLADRIERGPIAADDAVRLATLMAHGLEAAHERGVIHRDVKPANIKLTPNGGLKVLDFGLAKSVEARDRESASAPTLAHHATEVGVVLGTAAYMSPEQARGRQVDQRTDIWAFGCVLFEMLTGRAAFGGDSATDVLARVIEREPDWRLLPAATSAIVRRVLKRCLEKDAARRFHHLADVRLDLSASEDEPVAQAVRASHRVSSLLPWLLAVAAVIAAAMAWATRLAPAAGDSTDVLHFDLMTLPGAEPIPNLTDSMAVAPDGKTFARIAVRSGVRYVFLSRLDQRESTQIPASSGANAVRFSPDGANVAFLPGSGTLSTFSLRDGVSHAVVSGVDITSGFAWCEQAFVFRKNQVLWTVPTGGGEARPLTTIDEARDLLHVTPTCLPGGYVAFTVLAREAAAPRIDVVSLAGGDRSVAVENAGRPVWLAPGHLLFGRDRAVMAVRFDAAVRKTAGAPVTVLPAGNVTTSNSGTLEFDVSANGTLAYSPAGASARRLVSVSRDGAATLINLPAGAYYNPRVSPEGQRIALLEDGQGLSILDLARGTAAVLIGGQVGAQGGSFTTWNSRGDRMIVRRVEQPYWIGVDDRGTGGAVPQTDPSDYPSAAGPDPDSFLFVRIAPETSGDIYQGSMSGAYAPRPLIKTPTYEGGAQLSPDNRWMVYQSSESGQPEIYLRPFPSLSPVTQVSAGGGVQARVARNGREIYYRAGGRMMAVSADLSSKIPVLGRPTALFEDVYNFGNGISVPNYDVTPDGRFIMTRSEPEAGRLHVVLNWTEELKRLLSAD